MENILDKKPYLKQDLVPVVINAPACYLNMLNPLSEGVPFNLVNFQFVLQVSRHLQNHY
jgi:hypothetical protein